MAVWGSPIGEDNPSHITVPILMWHQSGTGAEVVYECVGPVKQYPPPLPYNRLE